jgi:predicted DNA-binding helix-hairpin-helix protein
MELIDRLKLLSVEACVEVADPLEEPQTLTKASAVSNERIVKRLVESVYVAKAPSMRGTKQVPLLKTLLTNACKNDCRYCGTSCLVDKRVVSLEPEELASAFVEMAKRGIVKGLFLSSAVRENADATMEKLIETAYILRKRFGYNGYLHLKVMPGASEEAIKQAARLADRLSCNLEAPNEGRLKEIAPSKNFNEIWETIRRIGECAKEGLLKCGYTTQLVVGAAGESDREILSATWELYRKHNLHRAYYSGFVPIAGTPMEGCKPAPSERQIRLYQADWLLRFYGFELDELIFDSAGNLPSGINPKVAWAISHPEFFPVEINTAPMEVLLRVPGIGPITAQRIVKARATCKLTSIEQLKKLGVAVRSCAPFILLNGRRPTQFVPSLPFDQER